jgi:uncharacterized protein (UPF0212 family)
VESLREILFNTDSVHLFDVGRSTCPQCLDGGVTFIQSFYITADVSIIQMHYAGRRVFDVHQFLFAEKIERKSHA